MANNGTIFEDSSKTPKDMKKLIAVLTSIETKTASLAEDEHTIASSFRRWSSGSIPTNPDVTDMKNYVGNLGLAVPAGFLMIHNDLARLTGNTTTTTESKSSSESIGFGDLLKGLVKGSLAGLVSVEALNSMVVKLNGIKEIWNAELPDSFSTLLAAAALSKYFDEAGFEIDLDEDANVTHIRRKEKTQLEKYIDLGIDTSKELIKLVATMSNKWAMKMTGLSEAAGDAIEKLAESSKYAFTILSAEISPKFGTLLATAVLSTYLDKMGFEIEIDEDANVTKFGKKQSEDPLDTVEYWVDKAIDVAAIFGNPVSAAIEGIGKAAGDAIVDISNGIEYAKTLFEAQVPEEYKEILAKVSLARYFEKYGYSVTLDEHGDIADLTVKDKNILEKTIDFVETGIGGTMKLVFKPLTSAIEIGADLVQGIDFQGKLNDTTVSIYESTLSSLLALSPEDETAYKELFSSSIKSFFTSLSTLFKSNEGKLPKGIKGNLLENLNNAYLEAVDSSLTDINIMDNSTRTIISSFDDTNIRNDLKTVCKKLDGIRDYVEVIKDKQPIVMSNQSSGPVANADLNAV